MWVVTGGSPCQDLSIAGKRAGLAGARSGLFMEQVRIVKEMREADKRNGRTGDMVRPRYLVWENVVGAFSSNKGRDFHAVLEEIARIAEPGFSLSGLPEKWKWTKAGAIDGDGWSIAWRTHDAKDWGKTIRDSRTGNVIRLGTPQRRRRISVVADFGGESAAQIQFNRESVPGHPAESGASWEETAGGFGTGADCAIPINDKATRYAGGGSSRNHDGSGNGLGIGKDGDPSPTITAGDRHIVCAAFKAGQGAKANGIGYAEECAPTLGAVSSGLNQCPSVLIFDRAQITSPNNRSTVGPDKPCPTLTTFGEAPTVCYQMQGFGDYRAAEVASSCKQRDFKDSTDLVCAVDCRNFREGGEVNGTLQAKESGGQSLNLNNTVRQNMVVRRLTPMECERLQGFPDHWTDIGEWIDEKGKKHKDADSPRYKALGNSIALPFWDWMLRRMARYLPEDATLGSLFDGIAGFPLIWERIHGRGTARWASEIEPFPIAVTKKWFGEE